MDRLTELFSKQDTVDISLEAVMFEDGSTIGSDTSQWIPRWQAWLDAEAEIFTKVATAPQIAVSSMLKAYSASGVQTARLKASEEASIQPGALAAMADSARSYEECRTLAGGFLAESILIELDRGDRPTIENILNVAKRISAHNRVLGNAKKERENNI